MSTTSMSCPASIGDIWPTGGRRSASGGELPVYILRAPASVSVEATGDASSDVAMPAMRDIDVTAAISEGKITVTEDRD